MTSSYQSAVKKVSAAIIISLLGACTSTLPNQNPTAKAFPVVTGESLTKESVTIPTQFAGKPVVLLIGFVQKAQFDIDRWILGLKQLDTPVEIVELPTIAGMMPGLAAGFITDGMRRGIPSEDWPSVITLFSEDATKVTELFGTENSNNSRVVLLDASGKVVWFHDKGYSASKVMDLDKTLKSVL